MPSSIRTLRPSAIARSLGALSLTFAMTACMAAGTASDPNATPAGPTPASHDPAAVEAAPPQTEQPAQEQAPMSSTPSDPKSPRASVGEPVGAGPFGQFIVKYRDGTAPLTQQGAVQPRLDRTGKQAGLANKSGLKLTWKSRMGIKADVFSVNPALDRAEAMQLMQTFATDPDVQFIEPDNHMSLGPIIREPMPVDK